MRYVSREGAAKWPGQHNRHEDVPLGPGDAAELLVFGGGLVGVAVLALVALWRLLAVLFGAG